MRTGPIMLTIAGAIGLITAATAGMTMWMAVARPEAVVSLVNDGEALGLGRIILSLVGEALRIVAESL